MKNFNEIYEKIHKENGSIVEQERIEIISKEKRKIFVIICIAAMISFTLYLMNYKDIAVLVLIMFGSIICISLLFTFVIDSKQNKMYKQLIIKSLIEEYSNNLSYQPNRGIDRFSFINADFERFDFFSSEDYIGGVNDNEDKIEIAEVKTQKETTDEEGNKTRVTLFHGLFCSIQLKKYIPIKLKIHSSRKKLDRGLNVGTKLEMDSSEFEKYFNVFTMDEITGMQILTSDLMVKLIEFRQKINKEFEITIKNNHLYIRIRCGEVFEASKFKETMDYTTLKTYYDMLNLFFEVSKQISENIKQIEGE